MGASPRGTCPNCSRMTANRELLDSSVGLVTTNALVVTHSSVVGHAPPKPVIVGNKRTIPKFIARSYNIDLRETDWRPHGCALDRRNVRIVPPFFRSALHNRLERAGDRCGTGCSDLGFVHDRGRCNSNWSGNRY